MVVGTYVSSPLSILKQQSEIERRIVKHKQYSTGAINVSQRDEKYKRPVKKGKEKLYTNCIPPGVLLAISLHGGAEINRSPYLYQKLQQQAHTGKGGREKREVDSSTIDRLLQNTIFFLSLFSWSIVYIHIYIY